MIEVEQEDPVGVYAGDTTPPMMLTLDMKTAILNADKKQTDVSYMAWIDPSNKHGWNFSFHPSRAAAVEARYELVQDNRIPAIDHGTTGNLMALT